MARNLRKTADVISIGLAIFWTGLAVVVMAYGYGLLSFVAIFPWVFTPEPAPSWVRYYMIFAGVCIGVWSLFSWFWLAHAWIRGDQTRFTEDFPQSWAALRGRFWSSVCILLILAGFVFLWQRHSFREAARQAQDVGREQALLEGFRIQNIVVDVADEQNYFGVRVLITGSSVHPLRVTVTGRLLGLQGELFRRVQEVAPPSVDAQVRVDVTQKEIVEAAWRMLSAKTSPGAASYGWGDVISFEARVEPVFSAEKGDVVGKKGMGVTRAGETKRPIMFLCSKTGCEIGHAPGAGKVAGE